MCELDHKESWALKNWCFWTVVLEKTLESPLDCKEINPVNPKENQSWIFIGRTDAEAETPILWPPDAKNWLTGKDPDAGEDWEVKGTTEDEMVGWHHWLSGHEFEPSSRSWWWMGKPGVLQSMESQSWTRLSDWTDCFKLTTFWVLLGASLVAQMIKVSACNTGDPDSIPGSGKSPGEGNSNPLQYSCLENSVDGGAS